MKITAILASIVAAKTQLKITIACDNEFRLFVPGQDSIAGPKNGQDGIMYGWANVKTYTASLKGPGPFVIGIHGKDVGVISALFAGITINGKPYTATGYNTTKFHATTVKPDLNWLDASYNVTGWKSGSALATPDCTNSIWENSSKGEFGKRLHAQMPEQSIKASWLPGCSTINNEVYFRVVIPKPKKECHKRY